MDPENDKTRRSQQGDLLAVGAIAAAIALLHVVTNGRYGFHRDELQVLDDARHLDWGYVAYPPLTPFLERVAWGAFGTSLVGLRMFSVLAQAIAVVLTGLMARALGGARPAQVVSALAVVVSPVALFQGTEFQYTSFDYLWCVLVAYATVRLLASGNPRWFLAVGAAIGVGMLTKYTMAFLAAGFVAGILLTPGRRYLKSPWLWAGAALALAIFVPNLIWQARHDFVSLRFLQHIHARDVAQGRADGFVRDQFLIGSNLLTNHLWLAGLAWFLFARGGRCYRVLGWMYVVPFTLYFVGKGRGYYLASAYPMLFAAGAVVFERWAAALSRPARRSAYAVTFVAIAIGGAAVGAIILPLGPVSAQTFALKHNGDLREEIGWNELAAEVVRVRDSLSPEERDHLGVLAGNYGETGALNLYGPAIGLPMAISGTNTAWYRGYGDPAPRALIVVGLSREYADHHFGGCRVAGHNGNPYGIENEESREHPDILVCGPPLNGWQAFWRQARWFG
jgi:hypothetical protein